MNTILARIVLSIALFTQGVGAIASEIGAVLHPPCQMGAAHAHGHGRPGKMPCCHEDDCTMPTCATPCVVDSSTFVAPAPWQPTVPSFTTRHVRAAPPDVRQLDASPPLRPPIA